MIKPDGSVISGSGSTISMGGSVISGSGCVIFMGSSANFNRGACNSQSGWMISLRGSPKI